MWSIGYDDVIGVVKIRVSRKVKKRPCVVIGNISHREHCVGVCHYYCLARKRKEEDCHQPIVAFWWNFFRRASAAVPPRRHDVSHFSFRWDSCASGFVFACSKWAPSKWFHSRYIPPAGWKRFTQTRVLACRVSLHICGKFTFPPDIFACTGGLGGRRDEWLRNTFHSSSLSLSLQAGITSSVAYNNTRATEHATSITRRNKHRDRNEKVLLVFRRETTTTSSFWILSFSVGFAAACPRAGVS